MDNIIHFDQNNQINNRNPNVPAHQRECFFETIVTVDGDELDLLTKTTSNVKFNYQESFFTVFFHELETGQISENIIEVLEADEFDIVIKTMSPNGTINFLMSFDDLMVINHEVELKYGGSDCMVHYLTMTYSKINIERQNQQGQQ